MVDHVEPKAIEVHHLVHRLADFQHELPVAWNKLARFDLDRFLRPRRPHRAIRPAFANRSAPKEIGDIDIALPFQVKRMGHELGLRSSSTIVREPAG